MNDPSNRARSDSIAYTEDGIPVQKVHLLNVPPEMSEDALKTYFLNFGKVLELRMGKDPKKEFGPGLSGDVLFANAEDAAKALERRVHYVDTMGIEVEPSFSWLQPDAYGSSAEDQIQDQGPLWMLTDNCWVHILQFLGLHDKVRFARTCQRFRAIYKLATAGQYKSVNNEFSHMTLWDIRDFYQMSGDQVQHVKCNGRNRFHDEIVELVAVYCRNLISLTLIKEVQTSDTMLKMAPSIEMLKLYGLKKFENLHIICQHFSQLRELSLKGLKVSGRAWAYIVEQNCCPLLESLEISIYGNSNCEIVAQLPKLKSLAIDIKGRQTRGDMMNQLVIHKAEQLEQFQYAADVALSIRQLSKIAKLTGLRTLILKSCLKVTDHELKVLLDLKNIEEISFFYPLRDSAILDLFIGFPKLSHFDAPCLSITNSKLVLKIVTHVRQEMANEEIYRELPIKLGLHIDPRKVDEFILNNPETVTDDIIKISSATDVFTTKGDEFDEYY